MHVASGTIAAHATNFSAQELLSGIHRAYGPLPENRVLVPRLDCKLQVPVQTLVSSATDIAVSTERHFMATGAAWPVRSRPWLWLWSKLKARKKALL